MARHSKAADPSLTDRLITEVDQLIQRTYKGLGYLGSKPPAVGTLHKRLLHRRGTLNLSHYRGTSDEVYRVPLLMVMALTNRGYIFDLVKGQSLIAFLLARGYDVYVVDWNAPTPAESGLKFEDYVLDFIPDCIRRVQEDAGVEEVSLFGYCMAGVLSALYAALHPDGPLKNLILLTTPTDWSHMPAGRMGDKEGFDVRRLINKDGLVSSAMIAAVMHSCKPAGYIASKIRLWDNMWNDDYVRAYSLMSTWGNDILPLPGALFRQVIHQLAWNNGLCEGGIRIAGRNAELKNIKVPLLHIVADEDAMVPRASSQAMLKQVGSRDRQELVLPGGHISVAVGPVAVNEMWPKFDQWLGKRSV